MRLGIKDIIFSFLLAVPVLLFPQEKLILGWSDSVNKYKFSDFDKAKFYADTAISLSTKLANDFLLSGSHNSMGIVLLNSGHYDLALEQFNIAEAYARKAGKKQLLGKIIGNQALCYERKGDYKTAFDRHFRALAIRQEINIPYDIATSYQNMAATYFYLGDLPASINYTKKAIAIAEKEKDHKFLGELYGNLGVAYFNQYKDSLTLESYRKALEYAKLANDKDGEASIYLNMVSLYNETGQPKKALEYLNLSRNMEAYITPERIIDVCLNTGTTHLYLDHSDSAVFYFNKALQLSRELGFNRKVLETYDQFYQLYKRTGDYKNALEYRNKFFALDDSVAGEKNLKNIAELEAIYKTERKNKEIELLNAENKIQKEKTESNRKLLWISLGGLILALVAAISFYRNFVRKKKDNILLQEKNAEIRKQKDLIAEKNKAIVDSITYAKRLQEAILPPVELIRKQLPGSFVLYLPKDIVAGDFYWMYVSSESGVLSSENYQLLAVADCTGHGVPGAMVSVVCANALNTAVKEFGLKEPGKILDKVNELVEQTFEKSSSEVKDGMDISLIRIEKINDNPENKLQKGKLIIPKGQSLSDVLEANKKYKISWSGANNPFWFIKSGEWQEIKADKQPVGKFENRKPFTTNQIELKAGDSFFLISDGFADQFGGPHGKKIKYKSLKELLYRNSGLSPLQQKEILEKEFNSWKGEYEQVDDVCVIGVKL